MNAKELNKKILKAISKGYTDVQILKALNISKWAYYTYTTVEERKNARIAHIKRI